MSILSDIYVSQDDEAVIYDTTPDKFADRAQFNGFTPLELSTLWAILRKTKYDIALISHFHCLLQRDGGEHLIHKFPAAMVTDLAQLSPESIADIATKWAATEELACPPDDICPVVEEFVRLARCAVAGGHSLYVWNCV